MLTVNELAKRTETSAHTVRYYIRSGLLTPSKTQANSYRLFAVEDVNRLKFIRTAKLLGFTLNDIQQILGHSETGASPCSEVRVLIQQRMQEVEEKIRDMQVMQERMATALERWQAMPDQKPDGNSICHLIESMSDI
ncbi:MAG: MerR family DNA-binding protein [Thiolinea sp.]